MENIALLPDETSKRFVAVLNKKIEHGRLFNALGHMMAGLAGSYELQEQMHFLKYYDHDGGLHPFISHFPVIVLAADNSNQIRSVRAAVIARNLPYTDFTSTMIVGTSQAQLEATAAVPEAELEYFGICLFGDSTHLKELTRKFSLFK